MAPPREHEGMSRWQETVRGSEDEDEVGKSSEGASESWESVD
jgi:hypothetical protein